MSFCGVTRRMFTGAWLSLALVAGAATADESSARDIMEKNFYASKIATLRSDATMVLINSRGQTRERRMSTLQKLQKNGIDTKLVMKFTAPADIRGVGFLQVEHGEVDDDQWIYLPALKKTRRLVANNKKDSFMGSDFSYGDFSRPKVDWYKHRLLGSEVVDGHGCYVVESLPANEAIRNDLGYGRKITWVRQDDFLEARVEYYDLANAPLKTQVVTAHKLMEPATQRWFAMRREVINHQTGHRTVLNFDGAEAGVPAPDDLFSTRTIERE